MACVLRLNGLFIGLVACVANWQVVKAQESSTPPAGDRPATETAPDEQRDADAQETLQALGGSVDQQWVLDQIQRLNHSSYRARQRARAHLEAHPLPTMQAIQTHIRMVDTIIAVQLVDMLSGLAVHSDLKISALATEILTSLSGESTSVGRVALNSMSAIADLQEAKAQEVLRGLGAYVGPQDFSINGRLVNDGLERRMALRIDDQFTGSDHDCEWISYLKSVRVVYLRGTKITPKTIEAVSHLKKLTAIKLRNIELTPDQLLAFQEMVTLEHLGLSYMDVDDSFVPAITQLPISQSIRLYGTRVTTDGQAKLAQHFDGIEVFRGAGGFLGVSAANRPPKIGQVTPNSAAERAGILADDLILAINNIPIDTFEDLRNELGKWEAGDSVDIRVRRTTFNRLRSEVSDEELTVKAVLQEEAD